MTSLIKLVFIFSISTLLQYTYCVREKRAVSDFIIPGINVGDIAIDALKIAIFGTPVDKNQQILDKQAEHMESTREVLSLTRQLAKSTANTPELALLVHNLQKIPGHLNNIDATFRMYEFYELSNRSSSDYRVHKFATDASSISAGPLKEIIQLYSIILPSDAKQRPVQEEEYSLISLLARHVTGYKKLCDKYKSQQMILLTVLEFMTIAEFKTFLIMEFSIKKLAENEQIDYISELDILRTNLNDRFKKLINNFQKAMSKAPLDVWRCDPQTYKEGETYFKMNVFQKYIARDIEMMPNADTCYYSCFDFSDTRQYKCIGYSSRSGSEKPSSCQRVRRCAGRLYGCQNPLPYQAGIDACPAEKNSTRRYEFLIDVRKNTRFGPSVSCKNELTSDYMTLYYLRECEVCLCICDDSPSPDADQKVNLRVATADKDHIVTGIRWLKKNHTLHLQIEQGKLLPRGKADPATVNWKDIQEPRDNNDIAILNWPELRGFLLQDIQLANDSVIGGVKLDLVKYVRKLITLRLLPINYEYESGSLHYSKPFYEDPDGSVAQGLWTELPKLSNIKEHHGTEKIPVDTKEPSVPLRGRNMFVELTTSDMRTDAGQTTVPFFDMQKNVLNPPVPLSGAGIYLKQTSDYAGFIALKLYTFNYTSHIAAVLHNSSSIK